MPKQLFRLLVAFGVLVNLLPIAGTIMEPDGALYASIAKTMVLSGDWVNLYAHGRDWLDKPHFPFWAAALSYKIFGISSFSYKLPALLFWALGGWYAWKLARWQYSETVAQVALLIYLTALHLVISNNDVRAEPYLTGMLVAAVYHFARAGALSTRRLTPTPTRRVPPDGWGSLSAGFPHKQAPGSGIFDYFTRRVAPDGRGGLAHLVAGTAFTAMAVMTKGIFILVPLAGGFLAIWAVRGEWWQLRRSRWWLAILLLSLAILPELYCLYLQFDLHPEKMVFGRTGVSGIRFFFWDSQFGRFLNNGPIKGKGDPLFFIHTLLWAFLPWSLFLYVGVYQRVAGFFGKASSLTSVQTDPGLINLFVALISFLLFSASRFQLPHYVNIVFPFLAILTASWLAEFNPDGKPFRLAGRIQKAIAILLFAGMAVLWMMMNAGKGWWPLVWLLAAMAGWLLVVRKTATGLARLVAGTSIAAMFFYGYLNLFFYPVLLEYQSGTAAANWVNTHYPGEPVYMIDPHSYSLELYTKSPVLYADRDELPGMREKSAAWCTPPVSRPTRW
ncbi:glycosyltransferase family 39 protein [Flavihumibacter stibioxidans]|uniref:Glycosyltransferase RgtA/B/C/D-like domain-containing protein n=1 Tax=Flavihumibacter stibioxidans TaxID=1834163 RepID=A0ABR7M9S6_9BACT|nr:glycosyltransferase family 39 protein [Flavihumibacter stibioxidans]MBC6491274.1 hypothetical protein [Flavihumibacter stibioxidans]